MARFVLSNRRAGKFGRDAKQRSRAAANSAFGRLEGFVDVLAVSSPPDELAREVVIFEGNPDEVAVSAATMGPDVLVEPEILHYPAVRTALPPNLAAVQRHTTAGEVLAGAGVTMTLTVGSDDGPALGAEVLLFLRGTSGLENLLSRTTGGDGKASFEFGPTWSPAAALVLPAGDYWTRIVRGPADGMEILLRPLPQLGRLWWWHAITGLSAVPDDLGEGVKVGVIDTGCGPHPHLDHVARTGAFIDANHDADASATDDVDSHGSHVAGTIGARPPEGSDLPAGVAPGVQLLAARVFPGPDSGASQGDIVLAIDHLSRDHRADLINLSLGAPQGSQIERDAIIDAAERGTLCVCAAGNSNGPVGFPAGFPEAIAVAALGLEGWGDPESLSGMRFPDRPDRYGAKGLFLANFSCFGPEIDVAAPGVGIVATVPARHGLRNPHGALDGTSMASPVACGVLGAVLSVNAQYLSSDHSLVRSNLARDVLRQACRNIGLGADAQGMGLISAECLLDRPA